MVSVRELPYGPAASYGRITRPDTWQHPTARQQAKNLLLLRGRPQMSQGTGKLLINEPALSSAFRSPEHNRAVGGATIEAP